MIRKTRIVRFVSTFYPLLIDPFQIQEFLRKGFEPGTYLHRPIQLSIVMMPLPAFLPFRTILKTAAKTEFPGKWSQNRDPEKMVIMKIAIWSNEA